MAAKSSRRTLDAAKRGASDLFERARNSKTGSQVIEPTMNAFGKSSELQASRLIDYRKKKSGVAKKTAQTVALTDKNLRGTKPNPLPTGAMEAMSQLAASRSRDRRAAEQTGMAADLFAESEEAPLLSLGTRSYARPEATAQETERERQRGMERTMRQFIGTGALNEEQFVEESEEAAPEGATPATRGTASGRFAPTGDEDTALDEALARAQALDEARRLEDQARRSQAFANAEAEAAAGVGEDAIKKMARLRIRAMIDSGIAGFEAVFPLIGAALLSLAWMIDAHILKTRRLPAPKAIDNGTGAAFCCVCSCGCIGLIGLFVFLFSLLASANDLDLTSWGLQIFIGLF
jgi:hypothetical protein